MLYVLSFLIQTTSPTPKQNPFEFSKSQFKQWKKKWKVAVATPEYVCIKKQELLNWVIKRDQMAALQWLMITMKRKHRLVFFLRSTKTVKRSVSNMITVIQTSTSLVLKEPFGRTWPCKISECRRGRQIQEAGFLSRCRVQYLTKCNFIVQNTKTNFNVVFYTK